MDHQTYRHLITDEEDARAFFMSICGSGEHRVCPRCNGKKHYRLSSGKMRCAKCKYTFHEFTGKWINRGRLSFVQWLKALLAFARECSCEEASKSCDMAYNTAYHCFQTIRYAICAGTEDGLNYLMHYATIEEPYFSGSQREARARERSKAIFGIRLLGDWVKVTFLPSMTLKLIDKLNLRLGAIGPFTITDRFNNFNHLIFYAPGPDNKTADVLSVAGREADFEWHWAKSRLIRHRGLSARKFPLYLKELEFRFNHKNGDLLNNLCECLCGWDVSKTHLPN